MRALRLGSYSMAATRAAMPTLSRLKSMTRYDFLCPPPLNRDEMRPVDDLPPVRNFPATSDFSGVCLVMSSRDTTVWNLRVAVTGRYVFTGISNLHYPCLLNLGVLRHLLAGPQSHVGFLPVAPITGKTAAPPQLARRGRGPHIL